MPPDTGSTGPTPTLTPEQRLGFIGMQVDHWRTQLLDVRPPEPDSSLAADDAVFPTLPSSQLAWQGIGSALDHMDLFLTALAATGTGFPIAYGTLARAGVLGAAHALWLLDWDVDETERACRALRMAHEEYRQERAAVLDVQRLMPGKGCGPSLAVLDGLLANVLAAAESASISQDKVQERPKDGEIIEKMASRYATRGLPTDTDLVAAYSLLWRQNSGGAHGLRWPMMARASGSYLTAAGQSIRTVATTADELATNAAATHLLTQQAIELYERRRCRPVDTAAIDPQDRP